MFFETRLLFLGNDNRSGLSPEGFTGLFQRCDQGHSGRTFLKEMHAGLYLRKHAAGSKLPLGHELFGLFH